MKQMLNEQAEEQAYAAQQVEVAEHLRVGNESPFSAEHPWFNGDYDGHSVPMATSADPMPQALQVDTFGHDFF